jgi:hypothetical protein
MKLGSGTGGGINPLNKMYLQQQSRKRIFLKDSRRPEAKNAGLKAVTLIATLNPVSQVLW